MLTEMLKIEEEIKMLHDSLYHSSIGLSKENEKLEASLQKVVLANNELRAQNEQLMELAIFARKIFIDRYVSWEDWSEWDKKYKEIMPTL